LSNVVESEHAVDMDDAVKRAYLAAQAGDTVLLAPACASFDMFKSFEHRGEVFKQAVAELKESAIIQKSQAMR